MGQTKVFVSLRPETIFIHTICPFSWREKYFSFHEFLHMIYGHRKLSFPFITHFFRKFFYIFLLYCMYLFSGNISRHDKILWTGFVALAHIGTYYDGHTINNLSAGNMFSNEKLWRTIYRVPESKYNVSLNIYIYFSLLFCARTKW